MLAGCSAGSNTRFSPSPTLGATTAQRTRPDVRYGVLYSFKGDLGDGAYPLASLVNVNRTLYGKTEEGGASGPGTVFSLTL